VFWKIWVLLGGFTLFVFRGGYHVVHYVGIKYKEKESLGFFEIILRQKSIKWLSLDFLNVLFPFYTCKR
jgi:hypothetical protein